MGYRVLGIGGNGQALDNPHHEMVLVVDEWIITAEPTYQGAERAGPGGVRVEERDFQNLARSVGRAGRIRRGRMRSARVFTFRPADIKSIRLKLGKSQSEFALMIGVSPATLQNWEQGGECLKAPRGLR